MSKKQGVAPAARKLAEFQETLRCQLTRDEIGERRKRVTELLRDKERLVLEKKQAASHYKSKIEKVEASISEALSAAEAGHEDRQVTVEEWIDGAGTVTRRRLDTMEVIRTRKASQGEAQEALPHLDGDAVLLRSGNPVEAGEEW